MTNRLCIFCNFGLNEATTDLLRAETSAHHLLFASDGEPDWDGIDIAFGQPDVERVVTSQQLKWAHISSAGYTRYDSESVREALRSRGAALTTSSNVFDEPCAQHLLAMMLANSRGLLPCHESQLSSHDWNDGRRRAESFLLRGQQVLVLGFGAIAQRLVAMLQPFDMQITVIRRSPAPFEGVQVLGEDDEGAVNEALAGADHVLSTLPESDATQRWMNAERFGAMKQGAYFYNIGRGATVDQEALARVLVDGKLAGAYLDVTSPEPLPPEHPLWTTRNCFITPHIGGGHADEASSVVRHFAKNLRRFENGEALLNRVF